MRPPTARLRRSIALLVLGMALHVVTQVLAETPRVVLVGPSPQHPLVARMRDELQVLGMEVEVEAPGDAAGDLAAVGRRRGAAAVARIQASPPEIFLWVDPARGGSEGLRAELRVSESVQGPASPGLLPLRAVELLRGMLINVGGSARIDGGDVDLDAGRMDGAADRPDSAGARAGEVAAPPSSAQGAPALPVPVPSAAPSAPAPSGRLSLHVAAAVLLSPGGVPAAPQARIGAEFRPLPRFGLEAMVYIPTTASTVSSSEGAIHLRVLDFGVDFRGLLTEPGANLSLLAGLGLGAMVLFFDGDATPPNVAARGSRWVAAPYGALTTSYRFHPRFAVRADMLAALVRPEPVLRIVERDAASFGQPVAVFLSLGLEVRP